jgi:hypothetical protein
MIKAGGTVKLKKNFRAKLAAVVASTLALGSTWILVRHNPPSADAGADPPPVATSTSLARPSSPNTRQQQQQQPAQPKQSTSRHTRTRAS